MKHEFEPPSDSKRQKFQAVTMELSFTKDEFAGLTEACFNIYGEIYTEPIFRRSKTESEEPEEV